MLWIDANGATEDELLRAEPGLADLRESENLKFSGPDSITAQAWTEVSGELLRKLQPLGAFGNLAASEGQLLIGRTFIGVSGASLSQLVVSQSLPGYQSPLQRYLIARVCTLAYEAAANEVQSERYKDKRDAWAERASAAWRSLMQLGVGYVPKPLPRPGAAHEANVGTLIPADFTKTGGTGNPLPVSLALAWVSDDFAATESALSDPNTILAANGATITASIAGLRPPSSTASAADGVTRLTATHWAVYALSTRGEWIRQALTAIATTSASFTLSWGGQLASGGQVELTKYAFTTPAQRG